MSQQENFKLLWLPYLVLMLKQFELSFLGGWRTEKGNVQNKMVSRMYLRKLGRHVQTELILSVFLSV